MLFTGVYINKNLVTDDVTTSKHHVSCDDVIDIRCLFTNTSEEHVAEVTCEMCDVSGTCLVIGQSKVKQKQVRFSL